MVKERLRFVILSLILAPLALRAQTITGATGQVGVAYSYQVTSNATPPLVYSATGLPAGLAINASSGLITGTPTAAGTSTGSVSILSGGLTNTAAISITINAAANTPAITSATTASGTVGTAFATYTVTASNSPTSFNVGALPAGLVLGGTATAPTISGSPTAATTGSPFQVSLSANNASGTGATTILNLTIAAAAGTPVITSNLSPAALTLGAAMAPYTITATNSPTSFSASGLPVGLSLNSTSGVISGTPTAAGSYSVSVNASNASGAGATATVNFTVGGVPVINSSLAASGNVGTAFSYTLTATPAATSFNIGALPAGLTANTTTGVISGTPTTTGVTSVTVSANNAVGSGGSTTLVITINAAIVTPPGGGGGGGGIVTPPTVTLPVITAQPASQSATAGDTVTLSVSATGTGLNFQWSKNGEFILEARSATLTLTNVSASDAGTYSVFISNTAGSVTSSSATLTIVPRAVVVVAAPVITAQPVAASVIAGGAATLSVTATSSVALTYQWRKDGIAIAGATNATLSLSNALPASAGAYTVVVTNSAGSVTSAAATLTVTARPIAGVYLGTFGGNGGHFALLVRSDRTGVFLGFASAARIALLSRAVVVDASGNFSVAQPLAATAALSSPPRAAHEGEYHIDGTISANGTVAGTISTLNLTFSAPAAATTGATATLAGFYQSGAAGSSATSYTVVSATGEALVVTTVGPTADGGRGTVSADGTLSVTTAASARVAGTLQAGTATLTATVTPATGAALQFIGANADARTENEKLINLSTRSQAGSAANVMIAGFVVTGTEPKALLIRGIGPTLGTAFNVSGALSAARLEVFRGATSLAVGNDWGAVANAAAIAAASARVGAFALPAASRDAALLLTLEPGAYTAVVSGQGGVTGVSLVEVYDATTGPIPHAQRLVNISTRATAGAGDSTLIAGFVVSGTVPKRLLIRGAGPSLTQFGVAGALARPQLAVYSGSNVVAQNAGWSTSADASAITTAAAEAGAFAFPANSADAALILYLAPGAYSAQVSGVAGTTGVALAEVYELP